MTSAERLQLAAVGNTVVSTNRADKTQAIGDNRGGYYMSATSHGNTDIRVFSQEFSSSAVASVRTKVDQVPTQLRRIERKRWDMATQEKDSHLESLGLSPITQRKDFEREKSSIVAACKTDIVAYMVYRANSSGR